MIKGLFITLGETSPPALRLLDAGAFAALNNALCIARSERGREQAYRIAFRDPGISYALPCWIPDALHSVVGNYDGPHWEHTRALAARVLLRFRNNGDDDRGGNAAAPQSPPRGPAPSGALFADLASAAR